MKSEVALRLEHLLANDIGSVLLHGGSVFVKVRVASLEQIHHPLNQFVFDYFSNCASVCLRMNWRLRCNVSKTRLWLLLKGQIR